jgi:hypothetical protein
MDVRLATELEKKNQVPNFAFPTESLRFLGVIFIATKVPT